MEISKLCKVSVFDQIIPSNKQQTLYRLLYFCSRFPPLVLPFPPPVLPLPALSRPLFSRAPAPCSLGLPPPCPLHDLTHSITIFTYDLPFLICFLSFPHFAEILRSCTVLSSPVHTTVYGPFTDILSLVFQ